MSPSARSRGPTPWIPIFIVGVIVIAGGVWASSPLWRSTIGTKSDEDTPGVTFTVPPSTSQQFGTAAEIGTPGDKPNPGALYHGLFPSDAQTQERKVGGPPARLSGYDTWVRSVTRVPAKNYVDGYTGSFLRVHVTLFNRDVQTQHVCSCDFSVWTRAAGMREADAVKAPTLAPDTTMHSGARRDGDVYLYVGTVPGPYFIVYDPDAHAGITAPASPRARGVWEVPK